VIDLLTNKIAGEISDTPGVHQTALAPELGRAFTSNGKENKVSIVDLKTLQTLNKVPVGENPDAILYEPEHQEAYAFNGKSKSASVIGAKSGQIVATIPLSGKPEFAVVDPQAHRVYVNIEDKSTITAIDTQTHKIVAEWTLAPGEGPTGLAIDLQRHRLFAGCEGNQMMVMLDSASGKVLSTAPIGKGVDAMALDPSTHLAFSSNGEGTVTIAQADATGKLSVIQTLKTQKGARTMAIDPKSHKIYLPTADFETGAETGHHPKAVSGTMRILVYGPAR
jgi:YVTN family beta-propeller protein